MAISTQQRDHLQSLFRSGMGGNAADYAKFLKGISPLIRRIVARKLGQGPVDDVTQEILISIHKARHTYDGERPLLPWLVAIARFRITDHLRKHYATRRHQTIDIAEVEHSLADVTETMDGYESIDELLTGVPETTRRILTLMHVEGYTAREVGLQLGMGESAVKVAAHRAIKKLRQKVGI